MSDMFLFRSALKDLLRVKKLVAAGILIAVPCLLALALRLIGTAEPFSAAETYNRLSESLVFGFLLVILACVFATSTISQEVEQKTIVYLLTRPIPRWRILLMKFAATVVVTTVGAWLASLLLALATYGLSGWGASPLGRDLLIMPIACLAYSALFLLLATISTRPLILGLLYAFGVETWVPALPGNFKMLSLLSYLHVLAPHAAAIAPIVEDTGGDPFALSAAAPAAAVDSITPLLAWGVVAGVIIVGLMAACFAFSTREYVPREDV